MRRMPISICIGAAILLALFACSSAPGEVTVDASYAGKEVELAAGGSLAVTLESNPTTGFKWDMASNTDETVLQLVDHKFQPPQAPQGGPPLVGAGGKEVWNFKALKKGTSIISMEYSRPWEGGEKAEWTFVLAVVVK